MVIGDSKKYPGASDALFWGDLLDDDDAGMVKTREPGFADEVSSAEKG